jgi:hypothetical protein
VIPSSRIELAASQITPSGDTLRVELIKPAESPPAVLIIWPAAPSVTNSDPRGLASVGASVVRVLAEAQAQLDTRSGRTVNVLELSPIAAALVCLEWASAHLLGLWACRGSV